MKKSLRFIIKMELIANLQRFYLIHTLIFSLITCEDYYVVDDDVNGDEKISMDIMKLKAMAIKNDPKNYHYYVDKRNYLKHFSNAQQNSGFNDNYFTKCQTIVTIGRFEKEGFKFVPSRFRNFTCAPYEYDSAPDQHKHVCFVRNIGIGNGDECKTHYDDIYVLKNKIENGESWQPEKFRIAVGCKCSVGLC